MPTDASRLADYLKARRAQLNPEDLGYPRDPYRRVPGLRREEVADLAGISLEYYTRLEQGRSYQMSEHVLAGLTRALRLEPSAAAYFYRLALPAPDLQIVREVEPVSEILAHLVEQWSDLPVYVFDRNQDILVANDLAYAMFPTHAAAGNNCVLSTFMAPAEGRGLEGWQSVARSTVAALRFHGDPADPRLQEIVGELSVRDPDFRRMWADHDAHPLDSGTAPVLVDGFGFGEFPWQILNIPGGHFMTVWLALPGTFAADAIAHLRRTLRTDARGAHGGARRFIRAVLPAADAGTVSLYLERAQRAAQPVIDEAS